MRDAEQASRAPEARPRGPVRAYLETRGLVGGLTRPHLDARLRTLDGVELRGSYLPGPHSDAPAVLLAHGFAAHRRKPAYARLAEALADRAHVLSIDLRGHGQSRGASTLGDLEAHDVAAGVEWLRGMGHDWVAALGVSMGGTAVFHAVGSGLVVEALVAVSAPAYLHDVPRSEPMARLHDVWTTPWKRWGLRVAVGVDVVDPRSWDAPPHPVEAAPRVAVPTLVVHGADDHYFPPEDAADLAAASPPPTRLWVEPAGFGHAEDGLTPAFCDRLAAAIVHASEHGDFPAGAAVT